MKAQILAALLCLCSFEGFAQEATATFSGESQVSGLGSITLPLGKWQLEYSKVAAEPRDRDYYVFKKVADVPERVAVVRYQVDSDYPLMNYIDGIMETLGNGIPGEAEVKKGGTAHFMAMPSNFPKDAKDLNFSFIHVPALPELPWLSQVYLQRRNGMTYAVVYASQRVIDPEVVMDVAISVRLPNRSN
jgi:hypothetical protein